MNLAERMKARLALEKEVEIAFERNDDFLLSQAEVKILHLLLKRDRAYFKQLEIEMEELEDALGQQFVEEWRERKSLERKGRLA